LARASCVPQEALRNVRKFKVAFSKVIRLLKKPLRTEEKAKDQSKEESMDRPVLALALMLSSLRALAFRFYSTLA
jgi:hypothetical protein